MKNLSAILAMLLLCGAGFQHASASVIVPANNPNIQYFGRWSFADSLSPTHSWPGVSVYAEFEGTSIGVRMSGSYGFYNVFIDSTAYPVLHTTSSGVSSYTLASGLAPGRHSVWIIMRNEIYETLFSFDGFILDDGMSLLPPKLKPERKVEFVGDSFTSASGNEWTGSAAPADVNPYTNVYEGFGPITARHYGAQYQTSSRSGYGLVMDYTGAYSGNLPTMFDRTLLYTATPKWDFEQWIPNLVIICLGLNDYSGFGGYSTGVTADQTALFKATYHAFIARIRTVYPGVKILTVAAHVSWIQTTVSEVVAEEKAAGRNDVFYTYFPYYEGGYVNNGHPNVTTHHKIAERLIGAIDTIDAWTPFRDVTPPAIVNVPATPYTVYDTLYTLQLQTDTYAVMRYSAQDKPFAQMEGTFTTTGKRTHAVQLPVRHGVTYTYYARAVDIYGNAMDTSAAIRFTVDTTKYMVDWRSPIFDHSQWKTGPALFATGAPSGVKTTLSKVTTAYFRKKFTITNYANLIGVAFLVKANDGVAVHVNGSEVQRINMDPAADLAYGTYALSSASATTGVMLTSVNGLLSKLHDGENTVAVEVHGASAASDITLDVKCYDSKNYVYFNYGSDWSYYDAGNTPAKQVGSKIPGSSVENDAVTPASLELAQNYPNPFNPSTAIRWSQPSRGHVSLRVFDLLGREVAVLANEVHERGAHTLAFNASGLPSGVYFYSLISEGVSLTKRMVVVK